MVFVYFLIGTYDIVFLAIFNTILTMKNKKILVWLSGGVDSAVSAYLLKQEWYDVTAGFMINYLAPEGELCPTREDIEVAKQVAEYLDIPFFTFDYREEYEKKVLQYMYEGYKQGITPNPDIMCNSEIKFKVFLDEALELGFDMVATGHYGRIVENDRYFKLHKWVDQWKDQSYFLAGLSQNQLSKALFPIGHLEKLEVRNIAQKIGLPNAQRKDSQGICFVGKVDIKEFLQKKIPNSIGDVVDTQGNVLGKHKWVFYYTIGQRKWLDIGGQSEPIFVVKKDIKNNILVAGTDSDQELRNKELTCSELHFLGKIYDFPLNCHAKIRYRQEDQRCRVEQVEEGYKVVFDQPQRAIAGGQIIALYDGDVLFASGVID